MDAKAAIIFFRDTERAARKQAVVLAREANVCRLCLQTPTVPLVLNYGKEWACRKCLNKEFLFQDSDVAGKDE